jgi:hypothetical protein
MRKGAVYLILSLLALGFFACQFAIPTAIEITGTPSIRFAETINIGKMFTDLFDKALSSNDKMSVFPCKNTDNLTYLIHMDLCNKDFDAFGDFPDLSGGDIGVTLPSDKTLIDSSKEPLILPLSEIGSFLDGFKFSENKIILYISGSSLIGKAKVDINVKEIVGGANIDIVNQKDVTIKNEGSKIKDWKKNGYIEKTPPSDGVDIPCPIKGNDVAVSFKIYIPKGETLTTSDFQAGNIKVEAVVWLPFVFEAEGDAEIKFPDDSFFSTGDDLFGRAEPGAENIMLDIIESLSVDVKFQKNPFSSGNLIIDSKNITIKNPISGNTLSFKVTEKNMKDINNPANYPFTPNFKISFKSGDKISFPRIFNVTEFAFQAKIRYRIDF